MNKIMKTQAQVRASFWGAFPEFADQYRKTYRQNQYNATIRTAFVDYVDSLAKGGEITEKLASRVTL
jgi:hypothetical protein